MEIKLNCPCGQHYAFDVEPVNNTMPCGVNCPACGADGTQLANAFLAQSAPAPAAPAPAGGLRINRSVAAPAAPPAASAPAGAGTTIAAPPQKFYTRGGEPEKPAPPSEENVLMGVLGGVIAGTIGMLIWFGLTMATGRRFGLGAWLVGGIVGYGVRLLGKEGTSLLGVIASICAAAAILGGQFLAVNAEVNKYVSSMIQEAYDAKMESAKSAVKAKTDQEIKTWLTNEESSENVSNDEVQAFREKRQPEFQRFVDGTPSRAQFGSEMKAQFGSLAFKYTIFKTTVSLFTVLFVILGIVTAYRMGSA